MHHNDVEEHFVMAATYQFLEKQTQTKYVNTCIIMLPQQVRTALPLRLQPSRTHPFPQNFESETMQVHISQVKVISFPFDLLLCNNLKKYFAGKLNAKQLSRYLIFLFANKMPIVLPLTGHCSQHFNLLSEANFSYNLEKSWVHLC